MSNERTISFSRFSLEGHSISWVGKCPWTDSLCMGTDEGTFHILPKDGLNDGAGDTKDGIEVCTGDAINGIAFSRDLVAFSSPSEVVLGTRSERIPHSFTGGAHGIVELSPRNFLATLGDDGLLRLNIDANHRVFAQVARDLSVSLNFYKIVPLRVTDNKPFLCAGRRDGLLVLKIENDLVNASMVCHRFGGQDIIDVCPLNDPTHPYAAACLSRSCGIFIAPNVLTNELPYELRISETNDTAYSLLAAENRLFVLTESELLYVPHPISGILNRAPFDHSIPTETLQISASDMFLVGDQVALLTENCACFITVAELMGTMVTQNGQIGVGSCQRTSMMVSNQQVTSKPIGWQSVSMDMPFADAVSV